MRENTVQYRIENIIKDEKYWKINSDDGVVISFKKDKIAQGTRTVIITLRFPYGNDKGYKIYKLLKSCGRTTNTEPQIIFEKIMTVKFQTTTPSGNARLLEGFARIPELFKGFTVSDRWGDKKSTFSDGLTKKMFKELTEEIPADTPISEAFKLAEKKKKHLYDDKAQEWT